LEFIAIFFTTDHPSPVLLSNSLHMWGAEYSWRPSHPWCDMADWMAGKKALIACKTQRTTQSYSVVATTSIIVEITAVPNQSSHLIGSVRS